MAFEVTELDAQLVEGVIFQLDLETVGLPRGGSITVPGKSAGEIPFQFPPRITSDNKDNKWRDIHNTFAWEPVKMWQGSNARRISVSAVYIATGSTINGVQWTPENIAITTRAFKQYFYSQPSEKVFPVVELQMYDHLPVGSGAGASGNPKFRLMNVDVKPGPEIIRVDGAIFSLRTEVSMSLEQVTRIVTDDGESVLTSGNLPDFPPQEWY